MAFKVANTVVINDGGTITGLADGFNVNNKLVFDETRVFQGTVSGYTSGGNDGALSGTIDKFPFTSDTNATDVGELTQDRPAAAGQSSETFGYSSGGSLCFPVSFDTIDKFPFSSDSSATDVGEISRVTRNAAGISSKIQGSGYISAGGQPPFLANIEKFPFASDTNASDVGDLTSGRTRVTGQSSATSGYTSGGSVPGGSCNIIDKFPFSSDTNASDSADLTQSRANLAGQSSIDSGYSSGGDTAGPSPTIVGTIDKFPFSSDTNATDVGELSGTRTGVTGQQV